MIWAAIIVMSLVTYLTRLGPFILFGKGRATPNWVIYIGKVLPPAVMGMLIVYSVKHVHISIVGEFLPVLFGIGVTVVLHLWKRNNLISIIGGTLVYMLLIR
ncbi:MAG: branched-chain amino acid transporter AzlD [Clostridiales bacterium 38-18]|nr:MAG: branched-chain amino acid transporter AzlD [Clostridiales bacterium 38-18]